MVRPPYGRCPTAAALALAAVLHGIAAHGAEIVLLDFWSPTCGPCMQMKPTVESLINARYPIRQVNVSQESDLARQFGVTGIPCFVMLVDGREVDRVVGATSSERLQQMFTRAKDVVATQRRVRGQSPNDQPAPPVASDQKDWKSDGALTASVPTSVTGNNAATSTQHVAPIDTAALPQQLNSKLLSSSVRLTVTDAQVVSHGTGTVIDAREGEALVITCAHLFRDSKGQGPVEVELYELGPQGFRVVESLRGRVVSYDLDREVAFVSIRPTRPVCVAEVAPARTRIAKGDLAASVGCSNGQDPTVMPTRITWLDRYQGPPNIEASGTPVIGRSGGGLFNESGQLVGICYAADEEGNRGLYAGLESIHDELTRLGLQDIYSKPATSAVAGDTANGVELAAAGTTVRGQEIPATALTTPSELTAATGGDGRQPDRTVAAPQLNAVEQATLEEIVSRAATKKVVCIVQSSEPGVENEIIMIENASNEFVEALAARRRKEAAGATNQPVVAANQNEGRYNR